MHTKDLNKEHAKSKMIIYKVITKPYKDTP